MCTVSFVPGKHGVVITSNRDEKSSRLPALLPALYKTGGHTLLYPKDADRGGTWIAVTGNGHAAVLLNGASLPHQPGGQYTTSRGAVIPAVLTTANPVEAFRQINLFHTEPFTLVLYHRQRLFQCQWDGQEKTVQELSGATPHIWSSATLYNGEAMDNRKAWFAHWLQQHPSPLLQDVLNFHCFTGEGDQNNSLVMNRNNEFLTVSITSVHITPKGASMEYFDLPAQKRYRQTLSFSSRGKWLNTTWWRRFFIRLRHWEYWPFHAVYLPVYAYWFWLCLKARSFFFFNTANPTIRNGGFLMESKKEIYDLLPPGTYPETVLIPAGKMAVADVMGLLHQHNLSFPLIAKPDIGLRGLGVKKIGSAEEMAAYHNASNVDYLVQAFVPYTREVGVFFYRLPGQRQGRVTGIVAKELLTVKGNGQATLAELLQKEERFFLQLPALRKQYGSGLTEVLASGEERLVAPYGNHSRGAKFLDITHRHTPELFATINDLCCSVRGFYFGRLDIKYDNWEDLVAGRNFSVIELNGAGSEPAHIYDPAHSLFFAWKEIMRHLRILYRVSKANKQNKQLPYLTTKEGLRLLRDNSAYLKKIS